MNTESISIRNQKKLEWLIRHLGNSQVGRPNLLRWFRNLPKQKFTELGEVVYRAYKNFDSEEGALVSGIVMAYLTYKKGKNHLSLSPTEIVDLDFSFMELFMAVYLEKCGFAKIVKFSLKSDLEKDIRISPEAEAFIEKHGLNPDLADVFVYIYESMNPS